MAASTNIEIITQNGQLIESMKYLP